MRWFWRVRTWSYSASFTIDGNSQIFTGQTQAIVRPLTEQELPCEDHLVMRIDETLNPTNTLLFNLALFLSDPKVIFDGTLYYPNTFITGSVTVASTTQTIATQISEDFGQNALATILFGEEVYEIPFAVGDPTLTTLATIQLSPFDWYEYRDRTNNNPIFQFFDGAPILNPFEHQNPLI